MTRCFCKLNNKLINLWEIVISYSLKRIVVFLKVPMLIIIRFGENNVFGATYIDLLCQRMLHAVLWSHIGILMYRLAAEPCSTAGLFPVSLSMSLWNDLANPIFDGVGLVGFESRVNAFLLT